MPAFFQKISQKINFFAQAISFKCFSQMLHDKNASISAKIPQIDAFIPYYLIHYTII